MNMVTVTRVTVTILVQITSYPAEPKPHEPIVYNIAFRGMIH